MDTSFNPNTGYVFANDGAGGNAKDIVHQMIQDKRRRILALGWSDSLSTGADAVVWRIK